GHERCRARGLGHDGHGRDRDALVGDGHPEIRLHRFHRRNQALRQARDFVEDLAADVVRVGPRAITQRDAHGHRTDVEVLGLDHPQGFAYLVGFPNHTRWKDAMMSSCIIIVCTPRCCDASVTRPLKSSKVVSSLEMSTTMIIVKYSDTSVCEMSRMS